MIQDEFFRYPCYERQHLSHPASFYLWMLFAQQIVVHRKLGPQIDVTEPLRSGTQGEEFKLLRVQPSEGNSGFLG